MSKYLCVRRVCVRIRGVQKCVRMITVEREIKKERVCEWEKHPNIYKLVKYATNVLSINERHFVLNVFL